MIPFFFCSAEEIANIAKGYNDIRKKEHERKCMRELIMNSELRSVHDYAIAGSFLSMPKKKKKETIEPVPSWWFYFW
jgi:hypothetical protein